MGTVVQKFDADGSAVQRELEKMRREYDKLLLKMDDVVKRSRKNQQDATITVEGTIAAVGKLAAAYGLMERGITAVNAELTRQYDLQDRLAKRADATVGSQADVARNMAAGTTPEQLQAFLFELKKINQESQFGNVDALQSAAASVLSATGADSKLTLDMLRAGAQIFRDKPADLATFAGGMADVAGAAGISGEEAAALMVAMQGQSRMTQLAASKHGVVAVKSGMSRMDPSMAPLQAAEEILGLFAGITAATGDSEGAETKTTTLTLLAKLAELGGAGTTQERLDRVRARIAEGELDIKDVVSGFGTAHGGAMQALFLGQGESTEKVAATLGSVKGSIDNFRNLTNLLRTGTPELERATAAAAVTATDELMEGDETDQLRRLRADIRADYAAARGKMRTTTLGGMFEPIWAGDAIDEMTGLNAAQMAQNRINALRRTQESVRGTPTGEADIRMLEKAIEKLGVHLEQAMRFQAAVRDRARNASAQAAVHDERD